ncbi:MAG: TonB-dependent receptor [Treponema sp.]|nr:TonB-dependent receptor [Treponema sp.]
MIFILLFLLPFSLFSQEASSQWDGDDGFYFTDDEGLIITGTVQDSLQTSQQISVVDREEIERRGAADLAGLLQESLGLNVVRYGAYGNQAGVNLRGFDSKRLAFLIDGVPASHSPDGKFDISQIDLNSVERIEVIYGGSDSKYNVSGALGGVINIITVKKQNPGWRFGGSVSNTSVMPGEYRGRNGETQNPHMEDLLDTQSYTLSAAYGSGAFNEADSSTFSFAANFFANQAQNHFLFKDYAGYTRRKDNNEVWDTGGSVSLVWELPDLTKLISSSNLYYSDSNFPTSGFSSNFGSQQDISSRQSFILESPRVFHDNLSTEASLSWQFGRRDYTSPSDAVSHHDQHNLNAINRWGWFVGEHLTLRSGIDYGVTALDSTEIGSRNRHDGGVYLTAEISPVKRLLIIPSVKAVFVSTPPAAASKAETPDAAVIPKLGILWNVTDSFALKNNYFRSFKYPDFEELYWSGSGGVGNPDLLPEDGWGADLGAVWYLNDYINLESVFYAQSIINSIHWYADNGEIWRPENVGEAIFLGLDNKINFTIPLYKIMEKINLSLSYQYLRSYLLSFGYTFSSDKRIPYNPEHTIAGSVEVFWNSGSLLISGHYESLRFHDRANITVLDPYFLLNASANQKIGKNFSVFGSLNNILNTSYESFYDYPMPGITLTLGMRFNFENN